MKNGYDRLLAAIGASWTPVLFCRRDCPLPDMVVVEVRRGRRWAVVPLPLALLDEPEATQVAAMVLDQASIAWELPLRASLPPSQRDRVARPSGAGPRSTQLGLRV